jgi:chemotaxis protein MotB
MQSFIQAPLRALGRTWPLASYAALALMLSGCHPTKAEMQAQVDKYNKLASEHETEQDKRAQAEKELAEMKDRVTDLKKKLEAMGMNLDELSSQVAEDATEKERMSQNLKELQAALDEYKKRAQQLERIQARFDELRKKLQELTQFGLKVQIRHNRMVISLPGDVLFDSGKTELKKEGKDVVVKVADVIRKDAGLSSRYFQVAGHTDNKPLAGGKYGDNWGLSAMRAREVLLTMVKPTAGGGGGLDQNKLHAAGFGETDPVATNTTDDGRKQNRRVELVVLPDVSEMLDLGTMAQESKPAEKAPAKPAEKAPAAAAPAAPAPAAPAKK